MRPGLIARARLARILTVLAAVVVLGACDDQVSPFQLWSDLPDTASLFSLARVENIGEAGAYDFLNKRAVIVEAQGTFQEWDVAVTEQGGEFTFLPAGMVKGFTIEPGIAIDSSGTEFELIEKASRDTADYAVDTMVPIDTGVVYIVRTRLNPSFRCVQYAKFEVLSVDEVEGVVEIRAVANPNCNDRALIPPDPT